MKHAIVTVLLMIFASRIVLAGEPAGPHSQAFCLAAVFKGLNVANPENRVWSADSVQSRFLDTYSNGVKEDLLSLPEEVVEAMATANEVLMNAWFAQRGFPGMNIQILPGGKAVGAVFDLLVDWPTPGKKKEIFLEREDGGYDYFQGVEMEKAENSFSSFQVEDRDYPVFCLETRQGWQIYLVEVGDWEEEIEVSFLPEWTKTFITLPRQPANYEKLSFPAVNMAADVDISWLKGLSVPEFRIDEAVKKVRLRLDDKGARAESAVAFVSRSMGSSGYTIKRPFYVIFTKDGLNFPPFVALAAPDVWIKSSGS